jgi:hypothetical protein
MKTIGIIFLMLFVLTTGLAQDAAKSNLSDKEITDLTSKLSMKLLLNEKQKSSVTTLLNTYRTELLKLSTNGDQPGFKNKDELISSINSQITALFDSKQKMKFDIIKKEWWESIHAAESN